MIAYFLVFAFISLATLGVGAMVGNKLGILTGIVGFITLIICGWIAFLFGWAGFEMSIGEDNAFSRWVVLVSGFLPLATLIGGFLLARQSN
jgi:hypothetical protein